MGQVYIDGSPYGDDRTQFVGIACDISKAAGMFVSQIGYEKSSAFLKGIPDVVKCGLELFSEKNKSLMDRLFYRVDASDEGKSFRVSINANALVKACAAMIKMAATMSSFMTTVKPFANILKNISLAIDICEIALNYKVLAEAISKKNGIYKLLIAIAYPILVDAICVFFGLYTNFFVVAFVAEGMSLLRNNLDGKGFGKVISVSSDIDDLLHNPVIMKNSVAMAAKNVFLKAYAEMLIIFADKKLYGILSAGNKTAVAGAAN